MKEKGSLWEEQVLIERVKRGERERKTRERERDREREREREREIIPVP